MKKINFLDRLRYAFDNTMSKGTAALIMWLAVFTILIIVVASALIQWVGIRPEGDDQMNWWESMWQSLMHSMDAGTVAGDSGWTYRLLMMVVTFSGIFIFSTLIGILSNAISQKIENLRKGKSFVIETNHTVILGWNSKVFTILDELIIANENVAKPRIVILADKEKTEMEDEINDKIEDSKNTKIICRKGQPNNFHDISQVNVYESKSIIILSDENGLADQDAQTIKRILAITNYDKRRKEPYHIVAEIKDRKNLEVAKIVGKDEVELVLTDDLISKIMVQTCRQSGLSVVYTELMDFDGDEIYFGNEPDVYGKTYGEILSMYEDSAVIGIESSDGEVFVNPSMDRIVANGDKIIAITEDDDTMKLNKNRKSSNDFDKIVNIPEPKDQVFNTLILGWNHRGKLIVSEIDNYAPRGSKIKIVSQFDELNQDINEINDDIKNLEIQTFNGDTTDRKLLNSLNVDLFDTVLVLSYINHFNLEDSDSQTLITLLHLRDIANKKEVDLSLVSEMMDLRNRELAAVTNADDFVVSDQLISLLMSQISENKSLMKVFDRIFDSEGSEIYLKPINHYIKTNHEVDFYTLVESARQRGETAIGYRQVIHQFDPKKAYGVVLNPPKSEKVHFSDFDKIIVLSED